MTDTASPSPSDLDLITRTVLGEAAGEPDQGKLAVANVIKNRVESGRFGSSVQDVLFAPKQFEPWTTRRPELMGIDPQSPQYQHASSIVQQAFDGSTPDPTNGATHFANVATVAARGDSAGRPGGWLSTMSNVTKIGNHTFGNADAGAISPASSSAGSQAQALATASKPITYSDQSVPQVTPTVAQSVQDNQQADSAKPPATSWFSLPTKQSMDDAMSTEWIINNLTANTPSQAVATPDPNWSWTPQSFKDATQGIPQEYWQSLAQAHSAEHAQWLQDRIQDQMAAKQRLDDLGWEGTGLRVAASLLDPTALTLGLATDGVAAATILPAKATRLAAILGHAVGGALGGAAVTAAQDYSSLETHGPEDYLWGAGMGLALGGTLGGMFHRLDPDAAHSMVNAGANLLEHHAAQAGDVLGDSSAGAMKVGSDMPFVNDAALDSLRDGDLPKSAKNGWWRQDSSAVVDRATVPLARFLGNALLEDGVGKEGMNVNGFSAELDQKRLFNSSQAKLATAEHGIFEDYLHEMGNVPFLQRQTAYSDFIDQVGKYIRNPDDYVVAGAHDEAAQAAQAAGGNVVSPHVAKLAKAYRDFYADRLDNLQRPMRDLGLDARPVSGTENIGQDGSYLPRIYHPAKMRDMMDQFGEERLTQLVSGAIRSKQPELDEGLIGRMSKGLIKGRMQDAYGLNDNGRFTATNENRVAAREWLKNEYDLSDADANHVLKTLAPEPEAGKPDEANFKRRIDLDEGFKLHNTTDKFGRPVDSLAFSDLLVNDASLISRVYNRRTSGRISMARVRIKDPVTGDMVVNGITSDAEWNHLIDTVKQKAAEQKEIGGATEKAITNLEWAYSVINGRPPPGLSGFTGSSKFRDFAQLTMRYNFLRLMSNMGWNQVHEGSNVFGQLGVKPALQQMPVLKRIAETVRESMPYSKRLEKLKNDGFNVEAYHGTSSTFDKFDPEKLGSNTNAPSAKEGFFFAKHPDTANSYTGGHYPSFEDLPAEVQAKVGPMRDRRDAAREEMQAMMRLSSAASRGDALSNFLSTESFSGFDKAKLEGVLGKEITTDRHSISRSVGSWAEEAANRLKQVVDQLSEGISEIHTAHPVPDGGQVHPVLLKMENPYIHDFGGSDYRETSYKDILKKAKDAGHDSAILRNTTDGGPVDDIHVVFSPDQIKSKYADVPQEHSETTRWVRKDPLLRELETMGLASEEVRNHSMHRWDDYNADYRLDRGQKMQAAFNVLDKGGQWTSKISGFALADEYTKAWAAKAVTQKLADLALNPNGFEKLSKRLLSLGLDEPMMKRIAAELQQHANLGDGTYLPTKIAQTNTHAWNDLEARSAFENAIFRWSRRVIQENDYGSMAHWMSDPMVQMVMQFRAFVANGWAKQFLHNLHMGDFRTFTTLAWTLATGAAIYGAQQQLRAVGRTDREAYLKRTLAPGALAWGAFDKAGWSSLLPMAMGTAGFFGNTEFPNVRSSGTPSDLITGNPSAGLLGDIAKAGTAAIQIGTGMRSASQQDLATFTRPLPWGNYLPALMLMNTMSHGKQAYPAVKPESLHFKPLG